MSPLTSPGRRDTLTLTVTGVESVAAPIAPGYDHIASVWKAVASASLPRGVSPTVGVYVTTAADIGEASTAWALLAGHVLATPSQEITVGPVSISPAITGVRFVSEHAETSGVLTLSLMES